VNTEKLEKKKSGPVTLGQSINLVRIIAAIFVISSTILQFIYTRYLPDFVDPYPIHWGLNIIVSVFFASTFIVKFKSHRHLDYISMSLYASIQAYTVFLALVNHLNPFSVILLILVMGGGTVIITNSLFYWVQSGIIIFFIAIQFVTTEFNGTIMIGFFNILVSIGIFGAVLFIRLRMMKEVSFSNSLLRKVQLFSVIANPSGQIVFVSPSIKGILGYDTNALLKDGWWENESLSASWIEKEYILNYPGIIRPEIKTKESLTRSNEGNMIWLSWTNSILPDGNYLGVAFDITKYRRGLTIS
jgi:PAS domain S-box-containing protein